MSASGSNERERESTMRAPVAQMRAPGQRREAREQQTIRGGRAGGLRRPETFGDELSDAAFASGRAL